MKKLVTALLIHLMILIAFSMLGFSEVSALRSNISHRLRHPTGHGPVPRDSGYTIPCYYDRTRKCRLGCDSSSVSGCDPRKGSIP
ncbi:hypothetical protein LguiA_030066 [Lonicera macranthoides]